ncbi:MAG: ATP-binding protein, partial [Pacificimonas sp.]
QHWRDMETENSHALPEDTILRRVGPVPSTFAQTFALGERWYQTSIGPLSNGHIAINHVDVTILKANEQQLLALQDDLVAARDRAEAANTAKSEFLAKMSHELRTPLNAVIGFADLIGQDHERGRADPARHSEYAKVISDSGHHLLAIVDDLLDLARIEAGKVKLNESEFDLGELIRSARLLVDARPRDLPIRFTEDLPATPIIMTGDQRLLRQAVINLMENAAKFCEGEPEIDLRLSRRKDGRVDIVVEDNGIGISEAMLKTVQDPFVQVEQAESRRYGGVGLGLALVRQFAELHGGELSLAPRENGGTVARISLPTKRLILD